MRIISQNKTFDIPYEKATIYLERYDGYTIFASIDCKDVAIYLGTYAAKSRAQDVMGDMQEAYINYKDIFYMPCK